MQLSLMPVQLRREIFRALVEVQDAGESVARSRETIAKRYELTRKQVRAIEDEGIDREWPPLSVEEPASAEEKSAAADEAIVVPAPAASENHAA